MIAAAATLALGAARSRADDVYLFQDGHPLYRDLERVKAGDVLVFSDRRFTVKEVLGKGGTTRIFGIGDGKALRVPLEPGHQKYVFSTLDGRRELADSGLPLARLYPELSSPIGEYAVVERYPVKWTLEEFLWLATRKKTPPFDHDERKRMIEGLVGFTRRAAAYSNIGDLKSDQLAWVGDRWVLLDWTRGSRRASRVGDPSSMHRIFTRLLMLDPRDELKLYKLLSRAHADARGDAIREAAIRSGVAPESLGCPPSRLRSLLWRLRR